MSNVTRYEIPRWVGQNSLDLTHILITSWVAILNCRSSWSQMSRKFNPCRYLRTNVQNCAVLCSFVVQWPNQCGENHCLAAPEILPAWWDLFLFRSFRPSDLDLHHLFGFRHFLFYLQCAGCQHKHPDDIATEVSAGASTRSVSLFSMNTTHRC